MEAADRVAHGSMAHAHHPDPVEGADCDSLAEAATQQATNHAVEGRKSKKRMDTCQNVRNLAVKTAYDINQVLRT